MFIVTSHHYRNGPAVRTFETVEEALAHAKEVLNLPWTDMADLEVSIEPAPGLERVIAITSARADVMVIKVN